MLIGSEMGAQRVTPPRGGIAPPLTDYCPSLKDYWPRAAVAEGALFRADRRGLGDGALHHPHAHGCAPFPTCVFYLTQCIDELVLESQLPHQIVNLSFTNTNKNIKSTVLWGS